MTHTVWFIQWFIHLSLQHGNVLQKMIRIVEKQLVEKRSFFQKLFYSKVHGWFSMHNFFQHQKNHQVAFYKNKRISYAISPYLRSLSCCVTRLGYFFRQNSFGSWKSRSNCIIEFSAFISKFYEYLPMKNISPGIGSGLRDYFAYKG